jgi:hypothetical protein
MDDVIKVADQKLAPINAEPWQCRCQHVRNIEQQLMAREGFLDAGRGFVVHVSGDSDDSSDDCSDWSCGDEEGQACGDDIYADVASVARLQ